MRETIDFYAPDWALVLIWCAVAIVVCVFVLWMGRLFGRSGALTAAAVAIAIALGFSIILLATGPGLHLLFNFMVPPPLILGALLGLLVSYVWLGRAQTQR